jgi:hypothetical protein
MPPIADVKIQDWEPLDFGTARDGAWQAGAERDDNFAILCLCIGGVREDKASPNVLLYARCAGFAGTPSVQEIVLGGP